MSRCTKENDNHIAFRGYTATQWLFADVLDGVCVEATTNGSVELNPRQSRRLAAWLKRAADRSEAGKGGGK